MRTVEAQTGFVEADVTAILASGQYVFTDCYTVTLKNGDTFVCTNAQKDVIVTPIGGGTNVQYTSTGLKITGVRLNLAVGIEVDEQEITFDYDPDVLVQGYPIARALLWGRFDGATITRDRFFAAAWGVGNEPTIWVGGTRLFRGRVCDLDSVGRSSAKLKVKSNLILLNINMPKTLYQPSCVHAIYDDGCGLDRTLFQAWGIVGAGSTPSVINWASAVANMKLGTLYVETSFGVTLVRTIRDVVPGVSLILSNPLEEMPEVGHDFTTFQGCDRTFDRCTVLANTDHFTAFPFIPVAETAY